MPGPVLVLGRDVLALGAIVLPEWDKTAPRFRGQPPPRRLPFQVPFQAARLVVYWAFLYACLAASMARFPSHPVLARWRVGALARWLVARCCRLAARAPATGCKRACTDAPKWLPYRGRQAAEVLLAARCRPLFVQFHDWILSVQPAGVAGAEQETNVTKSLPKQPRPAPGPKTRNGPQPRAQYHLNPPPSRRAPRARNSAVPPPLSDVPGAPVAML